MENLSAEVRDGQDEVKEGLKEDRMEERRGEEQDRQAQSS